MQCARAVELERRNVASAVVVTEPFESLAEQVAVVAGAPHLPLIVVRHPMATWTAAEAEEVVAGACGAVRSALIVLSSPGPG